MSRLYIPRKDVTNDEDAHRENFAALEQWSSVIQAEIASAVETAKEALFPVGSIYIATVSTNPGTLLGFGTWTAFGTGRTLVGIDSGQTEFDTVEETGGAKTHTLSTAEMPSHSHGGLRLTAETNFVPAAGSGVGDLDNGEVVENTGGGGAHNNLQPYIVVYMWKRTA